MASRGKRVGIVGAGAAGLVSVRLALQRGFVPVAWEQSDRVGGTWVYTPRTTTSGRDGRPVHSAMYQNLRTNLPKEVMNFSDFPFPEGRSFVRHDQVLDYLERYADRFGLRDCIQFRSRVVRALPAEEGGWRVRVETETETDDPSATPRKRTEEHRCDALMVCNGHFSEPSLPALEGSDSFTGRIVHSHAYRVPDAFAGERVVCLGAGSSGQDIALELATVATEVLLSHAKPRPRLGERPPNLRETGPLVRLGPGRACQLAGEARPTPGVDAVVLCTGYRYAFPFLDQARVLSVGEGAASVAPLHRHLVCAADPTLAVVGLPQRVVPFPLFELQAAYFLAMLEGRVQVPPREQMLGESAARVAELGAKGLPPRFVHHLEDEQWEYLRQLARDAGVEGPPAAKERLYAHVRERRRRCTRSYRRDNFALLDDQRFACLPPSADD